MATNSTTESTMLNVLTGDSTVATGESSVLNVPVYEKITEFYSLAKYGDFEVVVCTKGKYAGYINGAKLCQSGKKLIGNWNKTQPSKNLIKEVERYLDDGQKAKYYEKHLSGKGTYIHSYLGTYIHPYLIIHVASWISPLFAINVSKIVDEWKNMRPENEQRFWVEMGESIEEDKKNDTEGKLESAYRDRSAKEEGGETEVETECGFIDILTSNKVIEVKCGKNWKHAVGQVICYSMDYPDHERWIYLFDHDTLDKEMIGKRCKNCNVYVRYLDPL